MARASLNINARVDTSSIYEMYSWPKDKKILVEFGCAFYTVLSIN